jgi:hypothetical protein
MIISFANKKFHLSNWSPIRHYSDGDLNWVRYDLDDFTDSKCIIHGGGLIQAVWFYGSLHDEIGNLYLNIFETRDIHSSMEDAKLHVDMFLTKYLKLAAFI